MVSIPTTKVQNISSKRKTQQTPPEWRLLKALYCWSPSEEYAGTLETLAGLSIDHLVSGTMELRDTNTGPQRGQIKGLLKILKVNKTSIII